MNQIARGLRDLLKLGLVEFDFNPVKVAVSRTGDAKLVELCSSVPIGMTILFLPPSLVFVEPELITTRKTHEKTNVWSLGRIIQDMRVKQCILEEISPLHQILFLILLVIIIY